MDVFHVLWFVSVAFTGLTSGSGVLPDDLTAAVGGTVTFITTVSQAETPRSVVWDFTNTSNVKINILTSLTDFTAPEYADRITFFRSNGSLELRNLALNDTGDYTVNIIPNTGPQISGQTRLNVLAPPSNVKVSVSGTDLVEFNSSVSLSCSSSGSSLSFLWLNGSSEVTATDRVHLSDLNRTVTIVNVSRSDQGPFSCRVSNAVSNGTSESVQLSISFGPDDVNLKKSPQQEHYVKGLDVDLSCSAASSPAAQFKWFLNRTQLPGTGAELRLRNIQTNQSGDYSCQAFNTKTLRYQTSQPSALLVLEEGMPSSGCSAGCIAGIVIACVVVVVVVVLLVYYFGIKPKKKKQSSHIDASNRTGGEGQDDTTFQQDQQLHYADVRFQNRAGRTAQLGPENSTQYAEIHAYKPNSPSSPPTYDAHMHRMKGKAPQPGANGARGAQVHEN